MLAPLQLSTAVATPSEGVCAGSCESVHAIVTAPGAVTTGPTVSCTVIVCAAVPVLPQVSTELHVLTNV